MNNPGAKTCSDACNGAPFEVSEIEGVSAMSKSLPSLENRVLDGLGTMSSIDEIEAPNENRTISVTGADGDTCMAGVELATTSNGRLCRKSCKIHHLENSRSKKALLAARIGLKVGNEDFDFDKIGVCASCKECNKVFPKRMNLITEITRRWQSATRKIKRCKTWKFQRMKEWLKQHAVSDEADAQLVSSEEKHFCDVTKDSNDKVAELEILNDGNDADRRHMLLP